MPVNLKGFTELQASMGRAATEMEDMSQTESAIAAIIVRAVRPPRRTGRLAQSIAPVPGKGAQVGVGVVYGGVQEFGWPARNIRGQHYLQRALEATQAEWLDATTDGLQTILNGVKGA